MFGAEKFASTSKTFLSKFFANEIAVSRARVVFPTPPFIDTKLRMFVILSPLFDQGACVFKSCVDLGVFVEAVTLRAGFEPAASSLEGWHSIQTELPELDFRCQILFLSFVY